jgi:hypothetical protein
MNFIQNIKIEKYRAAEPMHRMLSDISSQCHKLAAKSGQSGIAALQNDIDSAAAKIWSITAQELECLRVESGSGEYSIDSC